MAMSPGSIFKLKPTARITWLAVRRYADGETLAVRCNSPEGKGLLAWMRSGQRHEDCPFTPMHLTKVGTSFYSHDNLIDVR